MTGATLASNFELFSKPLAAPHQEGYSLLIFATNWGYSGTWEEFCRKISELGYDGAELWYPSDQKDRDEVFAAFKKYKLKMGFLVGGWERDPKKHYQQFKDSLEGAASQKPVYINCHSGKDYFSYQDNKPFIDLGVAVAKSSGVPVYHETHRSRILYAAPVAREYMQKHPELRVTFDVSHWCNVHESSLEDQPETLAMTLDRVDHIHARIGHSEGPQVNDPRAPEWNHFVKAHFDWWDKVVERKKREGKLMTFLTEFGPVDYMPAMPYTRQPLANQWDINKHMLDTLRSRYA
jgi:sugar phosphate isomerase/epimerase